MILHGNFFRIMWQYKKLKFKFLIWSLMELELKITCTCYQAKKKYSVKRHWLPRLLQKFSQGGSFNKLDSNLPSDLLSDYSSNTSFKKITLQSNYKMSQLTLSYLFDFWKHPYILWFHCAGTAGQKHS